MRVVARFAARTGSSSRVMHRTVHAPCILRLSNFFVPLFFRFHLLRLSVKIIKRSLSPSSSDNSDDLFFVFFSFLSFKGRNENLGLWSQVGSFVSHFWNFQGDVHLQVCRLGELEIARTQVKITLDCITVDFYTSCMM